MDYQNGYADLIMVKNNGNDYDRNNYEINTNKRNCKINSKIKISLIRVTSILGSRILIIY